MDEEKQHPDESTEDEQEDVTPVDGPGGGEEAGGLGATSQGSPGDAEGGGTSGV